MRIKFNKFRRHITTLLILIAAFFAPWGTSMKSFVRFDVSKVFVVLSVIIIINWLLFEKQKAEIFPRYFKFFLLFIALHTLVTYLVFYPNELSLGYIGESRLIFGIKGAPFTKNIEKSGMVVARFFLFALFACSLVNPLKDKKRLTLFIMAYGAGFVSIMAIGGHMRAGMPELRYSGGYTDPNALAMTAITIFFLSIYGLSERRTRIWYKIVLICFAFLAVSGLLLSASRGAMVGFLFGLLTIVLYTPRIGRRIAIMTGLVLLCLSAVLLVSDATWEVVVERLAPERIRIDRMARRLDIWEAYVHRIPQYAFTGVGMARKVEVVRDSLVGAVDTHSLYLSVLVEYGIVGLTLLLWGLWQLWAGVLRLHPRRSRKTADAAVLALFVSLLVAGLSLDIISARDTWIILAIVSAYGSRELKPSEVMVRSSPRLHRRPLPSSPVSSEMSKIA